jgi:hypothetical protein
MNFDPKGSLPKKLINQFTSDQAQTLVNLEKFYLK